jgi:hypothetical protein
MSAAGPFLDADIARTLWKALVVHDATTGESYLVGDDWLKVPLPRFSIDIEETHRVVGFMQAAGWTLTVKQVVENGTGQFMTAFIKADTRHYQSIKHESLAVAICLAALSAFGGLNVVAPT